jgi:hypothetical protein
MGRDHSDFCGAVVALGRLGIVSALTLDLVPSFHFSQYVYDDLPNERLDGDFDAIFASGYSVSVFTDLRRNTLWCKQLAADPSSPPEWFGARAADGRRGSVALGGASVPDTGSVIGSRSVSSAPVGYRFPREVIAVAVRWYPRHGLSYRDVEELSAERGITVDHVRVYRWLQTFTGGVHPHRASGTTRGR